jgi:hypothetical protein
MNRHTHSLRASNQFTDQIASLVAGRAYLKIHRATLDELLMKPLRTIGNKAALRQALAQNRREIN